MPRKIMKKKSCMNCSNNATNDVNNHNFSDDVNKETYGVQQTKVRQEEEDCLFVIEYNSLCCVYTDFDYGVIDDDEDIIE